MTDQTIMALLGFLVAIIAVVSPIVKLNTAIAKLTAAVENLEDNWKRGHEDLEDRVDTHDQQINSLETIAGVHGARLDNLEGKQRRETMP